jgi:hypothetical protein
VDWRARFQLVLSIVTTLLFLVLTIWAIFVRNNLLITFVALLFLIINASVTYRTILLFRRGGRPAP